MEKKKTRPAPLDRSGFPTAWNMLSTEELERVHRLMNASLPLPEYKLRVFLLLAGLEPATDAPLPQKGEHYFRERGRKAEGTYVSMRSWEIDYWIGKCLAFLDKPFTLTKSPYDFKVVDGIRYKAPDSLLLNITYQQYGNAQRSLVSCWNYERLSKEAAGAKRKAEFARMAADSRAEFLSHLYTAPSWQILEHREESTRLNVRRTYSYVPERAERNVPHFKKAPAELFGITYQLYQSTLAYYRDRFPHLFKEWGGEETAKDQLVIELETVNMLKRECHYESQQAVYDANAAFIFEDLNHLGEKARQIKEANAKLKKR